MAAGMDLSGHEHFIREPRPSAAEARSAQTRLGEALLSSGWAALQSARAEAIDIHLRAGNSIAGVVALRVDGAMVEASTRRGQWTHFFAVADVVLVQLVPRGGKRAR